MPGSGIASRILTAPGSTPAGAGRPPTRISRPGPYRFHVMTERDDGTWEEPGALWEFSISPTFYQTRWFYAACADGSRLHRLQRLAPPPARCAQGICAAARRARPPEPGDPRHAAAEPGRRGAAVRCARERCRRRGRRPPAVRPAAQGPRGAHSRGAPGDLGSAIAEAAADRPPHGSGRGRGTRGRQPADSVQHCARPASCATLHPA